MHYDNQGIQQLSRRVVLIQDKKEIEIQSQILELNMHLKLEAFKEK